MFAAAAIVAQTIWQASVEAAKWLATKTLIIAVIMVLLPSAMKAVFLWGFDYIVVYGQQWADLFKSYIESQIGSQGLDLTIQFSGIGGYLAVQTGLIDYISILSAGWAIYWVVAVLAKSIP